MSSILDALRKLEQEKAGREKSGSATSVRELMLDPDDIDLPETRRRGSSPAKLGFLLVSGVLVTLGIGAGAVAAAMMVARREAPVQKLAVTAPQTAPVTTTIKPVQVDAAMDEPKEAAPPAKVAVAVSPKQMSVPKVETQGKPAPAPAAPTPAVINPRPSELPAQPKPEAAQPVAAAPAKPQAATDIDKLPLLSESERVRLGLPPLTINIVGIPNSRNPRASALINMQKIYVGENIPGTSARLMDVSLRGVCVDVNGQRYFLPR